MFRTEINLLPAAQKISLQSHLLLIGSCFSDNIGKLLKQNKFNATANPFGVLFNPVSVFELLETTIKKQPLSKDFYIQNKEVWYNYALHSEISSLSLETLQTEVDNLFLTTEKIINQLINPSPVQNFLIVTLGTAYCYRLKSTDKIVANCHKMPTALFEKHLLSPEEITTAFANLYQLLPKKLNILLTVSPIRHIKDTIPLNAVSKSILRLACHQLCAAYPNVSYFPAYEIMLDDLRDYRFYEADMLHPTQQAIDYIFQKFAATYFDENATRFIKNWSKIYKAMQHKAFHPQSASHQQFLQQLLAQLKDIKEVEVTEEIREVERQLLL